MIIVIIGKDNNNDYDQAKAAEAAERAAFCRGELEEVFCSHLFLLHRYTERSVRGPVLFNPSPRLLVPDICKKKILRQKFGSKILHLNQVNFCPEAAHTSCPSNGRKGSFSPIEARARYLFISIIISKSLGDFRALTSRWRPWGLLNSFFAPFRHSAV